jgi:UDP-N-acetylglucosamine transferase subunit ALG13
LIFVTVGTQLGFDRLVHAVDAWAAARGRADVFAQIGEGAIPPQHIAWAPFLSPAEFRAKFEAASAIVAHAGMGTILTALELGKPILVMPRRENLREQRNDHQLETARRFEESWGVEAAYDVQEVAAKLDQLEGSLPPQRIRTEASMQLLERLKSFVK